MTPSCVSLVIVFREQTRPPSPRPPACWLWHSTSTYRSVSWYNVT